MLGGNVQSSADVVHLPFVGNQSHRKKRAAKLGPPITDQRSFFLLGRDSSTYLDNEHVSPQTPSLEPILAFRCD